MTDTNSTDNQTAPATQSVFQSYDHQATGLLDATFAETLGLSMHNAVNSQLNAQMSAATSITSACNRILQSGVAVRTPAPKTQPDPQAIGSTEDNAGSQLLKETTTETAATESDSPADSESDVDSDAQRKEGLWNRLRQNNGNSQATPEQS